MTTLSEIQAQIKQLQAKEAEMKAKELEVTLRDIVTKMQAFNISLNDLQPLLPTTLQGKSKAAGPNSASSPGKKRSSAKAVAVKYRGPNGETWSGRGLTPRWLTTLEASGKSKKDFLVSS